MIKPVSVLALCALVLLLASACGAPAAAPTAIPPAKTQAAVPSDTPAALPSANATTAATSQPAQATSAVAQPMGYPPVPAGIPAGVLPPAQPLGGYVAFAWNNLGMHCYQTDYSQLLILPPYNVFWAQVVRRADDPSIVSQGLTASYSVPQVTKPEAKNNFWQYAGAYGWNLQPGVGLTGKKIADTMDVAADHLIAEGVPVVDVNDAGTWDPYPFFVVDVQRGGATVAQTVNVAPASTEMSCYLCHPGSTVPEVYANILQAHDRNNGTSFAQQAAAGKPVMCNTCHGDAAMGVMQNKGSSHTLSGAVHTFHADKMVGSQLPANTCQACHPGPQTQCLRDAMAQAGITCVDCHGTMQDLGDAGRTPWVNLPTCESCHGQNLGKATGGKIDSPNQKLTASADALYRNRKAHGGGGIYCAACHGSPHAVYPTSTERDNQQSIRLQGHAGPINECTVCHTEQPDEAFWHSGRGD